MRLYLLILLNVFLMVRASAQTPYIDKVYPAGSFESSSYNIFVQNDGNYFIGGEWGSSPNGYGCFIGMRISVNGDTILHRSILSTDSISYYSGSPGAIKKLATGGYYTCLNRYYWYTGTGGNTNQAAGMALIDSLGDTIFTRVYTDTAFYIEGAGDIIKLRDGSYMLSGVRYYRSTGAQFGLLIHADSAGNFINEFQYAKAAGQLSTIDRIQLLPNGNILLGAESDSLVWYSSSSYYYQAKPWFIIIDTNGSLLKDTLYGQEFAGGGVIYTDVNGGYFHTGSLNVYDSTDIDALTNFPPYIAHLGSDFGITWIHTLEDAEGPYIINAIQLSDSGYLVLGSNNAYPDPKGRLWRLDKHGNVKWNNSYPNYSRLSDVYGALADAKELANGNIILTGYRSDTAVGYHSNEIIWLLLIDSNGCETPGCLANVGVNETVSPSPSIEVYPNPNSGKFTITNSPTGKLYVYSILGTKIYQADVSSTSNNITLPPGIAPGYYIGKVFPENGDAPTVFRIAYQP